MTTTFDDKWRRETMVATDGTESNLINAGTGSLIDDPSKSINLIDKYKKVAVQERFLYYYNLQDVIGTSNDSKSVISELSNLATKNGYTVGTIDNTFRYIGDNTYYNIKMMRITQGVFDMVKKQNILVMSMTHAREPASINVNISFVYNLVKSSKNNLLNKAIINIIFIFNPSGYLYDASCVSAMPGNGVTIFDNVPGKNHRKNKNPRGCVDLNRNNTTKNPEKIPLWGWLFSISNPKQLSTTVILSKARSFGMNQNEATNLYNFIRSDNFSKKIIKIKKNGLWGYDDLGSSGDPRSDTYRGAVSYDGVTRTQEPETDIFQKIFIDCKIDFLISLHSYSNLIIQPTLFDSSYPIPFFVKDSDYLKFVTDTCTRYSQMGGVSKVISATPDVDPIEKDNDPRNDKTFFSTANNSIGYTVNGDHTDWSVIEDLKLKNIGLKNKNRKFRSITLEVGNTKYDRFYPNKCEMIDIIYNSTIVLESLVKEFIDEVTIIQ
jgi:hypothetical protein